MKYVSPSIHVTAFNCPHCGALTSQTWYAVELAELQKGYYGGDSVRHALLGGRIPVPSFKEVLDWATTASLSEAAVTRCYNCDKPVVWVSGNVVWPVLGDAPLANPDMPDDIRRDYNEAGTILNLSPRGAAALLRLAIQKLCKVLGQKGKNIDDDIKALVAAGLNPLLQKALDTVRVVGNEAVHPGQIDLRDDRATAESLFRLVNMIVEKTISEPKQVEELYTLLPEGKRQGIDKRDAK